MNVAMSESQSRRGVGVLILLGLLALGVLAAPGAEDIKRYLRMRRM